MRIEGRVILITGASQGIGAACARAFAQRGARLSLTARSEDKLRDVGGPDALVTAGDITDPDFVSDYFASGSTRLNASPGFSDARRSS